MIRLRMSEAASALGAALYNGDAVFEGCSTDTRSLQPGMAYVALCGEHFDGHAFIAQAESQGAVGLVLERAPQTATSLPWLQVPDTRLALGQLAALWRGRFALPLVAVTGSNGKTTVKEMLRAIFSQAGPVLATQGNLNNDIGVPLTLFGLGAEHRYAVVEMGANHPGEIGYLSGLTRPSVALITQCAPAHLEGFASVDGVAAAKGEIFSGLVVDGTAVINLDDAYAEFWRGLTGIRRCLNFGLDQPAEVCARDLRVDALGAQRFVLVTPVGETEISLALAGRHNVRNALAAAACALAAGCNLEQISSGLAQLQAVAGRLQPKPGIRGIRLFDDTYNANPTSFRAAIEVLAQCPAPRWLVMGDMRELGESAETFHAEIGDYARAAGIEHLYALGPLSRAAVEAFGPAGRHFADHAELNTELSAALPEGASVLVKGSRGMRMELAVQALLAPALDSTT